MSEPSDRRGLVAVILAGSVGLALVVLTAAASWAIVDKGLTVPTAVASLLSTGFGAFIGAVATYLGTWRPQSDASGQTVAGAGDDKGRAVETRSGP